MAGVPSCDPNASMPFRSMESNTIPTAAPCRVGDWLMLLQVGDSRVGPSVPLSLAAFWVQAIFLLGFCFRFAASPANADDGLESILARAEARLESMLSPQDPTKPSSMVSVEEWRQIAHSLRLIEDLEPVGRERFVLPMVASRSKASVAKLREQLQQLGVLQELESHMDSRCLAIESSQADRDVDRRRWQVAGLRSILQPTSIAKPNDLMANAWDAIRVTRSPDNFPLVTWGPGTYAMARTRNFAIASQAGDKPTLEMAEACEIAFAVWQQLFAGLEGSSPDDAAASNEKTAPFRVVLFRNRDAYLRTLRAIEPRIGVSTGYYSPQHRLSFFYWDGAKSVASLIHELTHQFFHESGGSVSPLDSDKDPGYWAVEGVALYMESLSMRSLGGARIIDVGGWDSLRLQAGRYRRLHDEYWIPWDEFHAATGARFRREAELPAWYSQACGLTHRWLDGSPEERRQFCDYLSSVYMGEGAPAALKLGDDDSVREGYDRYLQQSWMLETRNAITRPYFSNRTDVVLARCDVGSTALLGWLPSYRRAQWLDLSFTSIDDRLFEIEDGTPWDVVRLSLESTSITDASMPAIAAMPSLVKLDLSHCAITDEGLSALRGHPSLRQLWLNHSRISDKAIDTLLTLPRLERLFVEGTNLSDDAWKRLQQKKPGLKR
jgi:hypothetical protein